MFTDPFRQLRSTRRVKSAVAVGVLVAGALVAWPAQAQVQAEADEPAPFSAWGDDPFAEGNRYWDLRVAGSVDPDLGEIYHGRLAAGQFISDGLALYLGASLGYADASKTDGGFLGGPEIGVRWHFLRDQNWSVFFDASSGIFVHEHPMTDESLRFNFNLQGGFGGTYRVGDRMLLQGGVAWHHLSNARIRGKEHNLGYDGPMGYVGLIVPF